MTGRFLTAMLVPAALAVAVLAQQPSDVPTAPPQGVEVQARGPVHEAFAQPSLANPQPSPVVPQQPPDPINEMPPEEKPEGESIIWIPGYWDWDSDSQQYLWVSGVWREQPPGRKWVPGFWQQVEGGWQRVPGFWALEDQEQFDYVPPPPTSLERGPTSPQPDTQSIYVPGCWLWQQQQYFWRAGFWVPFRPGWVWIPARYLWTPAGCLFVEGHWDHPLNERGLLFAPVRFDPSLLATGFTYVPSYVVRSDFLLSALFVQPGTDQYCFGDYFEERYARQYIPWVEYQPTANVVDPNFAYYRQQFAQEPTWVNNLRGLYVARYRNQVPRPPRTLVQQNQVIRQLTVNQQQNTVVNQTYNITRIQNTEVLAPLKQMQNRASTALAALAGPRAAVPPSLHHVIKLQPLSKEHRTLAQQAITQLHQAAQRRHQAEAHLLTSGQQPSRPAEAHRTLKLEVPKVHAPPPAQAHPAGPGRQPTPPPAPRTHKERPPAVHLPAAQPVPREHHPGPAPHTPPAQPHAPPAQPHPVQPSPPHHPGPAPHAPPMPKEKPAPPHPPAAAPPRPGEPPHPAPHPPEPGPHKPKEKNEPPKGHPEHR